MFLVSNNSLIQLVLIFFILNIIIFIANKQNSSLIIQNELNVVKNYYFYYQQALKQLINVSICNSQLDFITKYRDFQVNCNRAQILKQNLKINQIVFSFNQFIKKYFEFKQSKQNFQLKLQMKLKSGIIPIIQYFSRNFYTLYFYSIVKGFERGQFFSLLLILGKGILFILLGIYNSDYIEIVKYDKNLKFIQDNDYFNRWQTNNNANLFQFISLALNFILITYFVSCYISFILFGYKTTIQPIIKGSFSNTSNIEIDEDEFITKLNKKMQLKIYEMMSFYISIYQFLLTTPIFYYSLMQISHPLAPINILLTLISGTFIIDSDFDYSVNTKDCMSRPYNPYNVIIYYLDFLIMLLIVNTNFNQDTLFLGIYFLINGWFSCRICTYYQYQTRFWNTFTYLYLGSICLTYYICIQVQSKINIPSLMTVLYLPIFYKIAHYFCIWEDNTHNTLIKDIFEENNNVSLKMVDRVIRLQVFNDLQTQKVNDTQKIGIYSQINKKKQQFHQESINSIQTQATNQLSLKILVKEIENGENENQSIMKFFKEQIQKLSNKKSELNYRFVYLLFLLEVIKCTKSYFYEFQQMRKQKIGLKQEQILKSIHINFLKQRQVLQQTLMFQNNFDQLFYSVILYEEKIQQMFQMMDKAMEQKVEFISLLKNKQIQVQDLIKKVIELREIQQKIRKGLNELSIINNSNRDLITLQVCYQETLSFEEKDLIIDFDLQNINEVHVSQINTQIIKQKFKLRQSYKKSLINKEFFNQNNYYGDLNVFSKHSCVLFASFEDSSNLYIKKVSSNFTRLFGINQKEAVDRKIEVLMPPKIQVIKKHKQYIINYFQNENNNISNLKNKLLFGFQQKGFIFPMKIDVRLNYCNGLNEVGMTAYIELIDDENEYILFESDSLSVIGVTQNLQSNIFTKYNISSLKQIDLGQFFPFLYKLRQDRKTKQLNQQQKNLTRLDSETKKINSLKKLLSQQSFKEETNAQTVKNQFENFQLENQEYLLIIQNIEFSNEVKNQEAKLQNFSFFLLEISMINCEYKDIENLQYLKISKVKFIYPEFHSPIIIKYLKDYNEFYSKIFTKATLEALKAQLENQLIRIGSQDISMTNFLKIQQNQKENQFMKSKEFQASQDKQQFLDQKVLGKFSENEKTSSKNLQEYKLQNNTGNQLTYKIKEKNSEEQKTQKKTLIINCTQSINFAEENSTPSIYSPIGVQSQTFRSQEALAQEYIKQYQSQQEEENYILPLTSNRRETNRELLSEAIINSQTNVTSFQQKANIDENQLENPYYLQIDNRNVQKNQENLTKCDSNLKEMCQFNQKEQICSPLYSNKDSTSLKFIEKVKQVNKQQKFYQTQELTPQNFKNINFSKKSTQIFSSKKQQKSMKKKIKEEMIDNSSSCMSRESTSSIKKRLIKTIRRHDNLKAIRIVNLFGLLTYLALIIISIQQYCSFMGTVDTMNQNLNSQSWPSEVENEITRQVLVQNIIKSIRQNNFTFPSTSDQQNYDAVLLSYLKQSYSSFKNQLQIMDFSLNGKMLFEKISNYNSSFQADHFYNPLKIKGSPSTRSNYYFEEKNSSLLYSIIFVNYYMYKQSINPNGKLQEISVLLNLNEIISGIIDTKFYFQNYQNQQVQQIQNQLSVLIAMILIISAFCLLCVLPLYSYTQKRKDKIIQLFCTFPVNLLQNMIIQIRQSYYLNKTMSPYIKNIPVEIEILNHKSSNESENQKKQTLSQITKLPHFSYSILIIICAAYLILAFYPIFNKIFIQKYLDNLNNNLMMLENLNLARTHILYSSAIVSHGFNMKVYPNTKLVKLQDYISEIRSTMSRNQQMLTNLTHISEQLNRNERYQQDQFDHFFFPLFEGDMCSLIANNSQYISNSTIFNPNFCKSIYNGFLQKGLKLSAQYFNQKLQDLYEIIEINNNDQLLTAQKGLFKSFNIDHYSYLIVYLDEIMKIMKEFLLKNCYKYYDYLQLIQLILIIYQLFIVTIIFGVCWYSFSNSIANQITKIKHHLQVINVYYLLENNFILKFVKNNMKL
ncbi:transmembrane protein, putative (macronuclear) [Tetrahymena thermophila SB210]|uniref:Transmembrane protein, putative n=1 Tax=Tetrahymena thermophila (strain SB210) TaxID=312017 RepID=Q24F14_TETTS|nr:transmembrane protein, putative [Tetrahymena thermophila SB210]EAS06393.3 transmembrane protein, putative [Tetrahymena thermophila SB210]|eukprot:XP_001026638.3 transmembrane protein, putative [Tetrahymena thermophila SB210]